MEEEKKFTFNVNKGKTNYMVIKTGKETNEEPLIEVRKGKVEKTNEYKYLGNWIGEHGNVERQIEELEKRKTLMATEVMRIASEEQLGKMSTEAMILIYEKTVVPSCRSGF